MIEVIRNARVLVQAEMAGEKGPTLKITVNERYQHTFSPNSRESRMLMEVDISTIQQLMDAGTFVFSDGQMVDYRRSNYNGYVQSDEAIKQLIEHIGFEAPKGGNYSQGTRGLYEGIRSRATNGAIFGGNGDPFDLLVPELGVGGEFDGHIVFGWSVFSDKVTTSLNVRRLVCENGMVADAPFVTYEVPVINQWHDNLKVVNAVLKPRITDVLGRRFKEMNERRASLADVLKAHSIIGERKGLMESEANDKDAAKLARMSQILNPELHLAGIFRESAFKDPKMARQIDGHMTQFDVYNILTEASSHSGRDDANDRAATKLANTLVFDDLKERSSANFTLKPSEESDHRRAFFGEA